MRDQKASYKIINFTSVFNVLILFIVCKECGENIKIKKSGAIGLGFQIKIQCAKCEDKLIDSCCGSINKKTKVYDINSRIIFVMRYIDIGYTGLKSFCGLMDLPHHKLDTYKYKEAIPNDIKEILLPIYEDLSNKEMLTRCIGAYTQNANESLNNMIWKMASKRTFNGQEKIGRAHV